jgi:hypothetical protein
VSLFAGPPTLIGDPSCGSEPIYQLAYFKNVAKDIQGEDMLVEFDDYFLRTLEEKDIEKAALVTPASFPPQDISLEIAYVRSDGAIPESRSIDITVESARASAKPESRDSAGTAAKTGGDKPEPVEKTLANTAIPGAKPAKAATAQPQTDESAGNRLSGEEEQRLLDRAQEHLERGDIASARLILDYAAHQGSRDAAGTGHADRANRDICLKVEAEPENPYVQQQVRYTLRVYRGVPSVILPSFGARP